MKFKPGSIEGVVVGVVILIYTMWISFQELLDHVDQLNRPTDDDEP